MCAITFLFPIHARTLPGVFLRISSCHDARVLINQRSTGISNSNCCIGGQVLSVFLELARDCRKTSTWVTYGSVQMEAMMRMRRKEYVVQIKYHRESRTLRGKQTFTDLTWRHARVRPFSVSSMATLE